LLETLKVAQIQLGEYTNGNGAAKFHTINIIKAAIAKAEGGAA
jgi:hypothetical protein